MIKNRFFSTFRSSKSYLKELALDLGILEGTSNYERFIILGRSRVGSNFLRGLLNSHSQVITFGELFQDYDYIAWGFPEHSESKRILSSYQRNPSVFLEKSVFKKYPVKISAVGFKIFYYHAQDDSRKAVWEYLKNNEDLRVIHIKRKNILKTYLSRKRAEMTDVWADISGNKKDYPAVFLDYEECLRNFTSTRTWESHYDLFFDDHQKIDLYYENLARDYDREMKRVWELLGVDYEAVKPNTYKQATRPLSMAISNYFELREKFIGTPWEEFFED